MIYETVWPIIDPIELDRGEPDWDERSSEVNGIIALGVMAEIEGQRR